MSDNTTPQHVSPEMAGHEYDGAQVAVAEAPQVLMLGCEFALVAKVRRSIFEGKESTLYAVTTGDDKDLTLDTSHTLEEGQVIKAEGTLRASSRQKNGVWRDYVTLTATSLTVIA